MSHEIKLNYSLTHSEATEYLKKVALKSTQFAMIGFGIIAILAMLASMRANDMVYAETFLFGSFFATTLIMWSTGRKLLRTPTLPYSNEVALTEKHLYVRTQYPKGNNSEVSHLFSYDYLKQIVELPQTFIVECHELKGNPIEIVIIPKRVVADEAGKAFMATLRENLAKSSKPC